MSEKITNLSHENHSNASEKSEQQPHKQEREIKKHERDHGNTEQLEAHRAAVEKHAKSKKEHTVGDKEKVTHHPILINKQLKDTSFSRTMTRTRKKLSIPSRALSKVIHNPVVEQTSEVLGKTVARPSSMLGGAFFALVGTSLLLWITRYYGYEYNYFAVILLFGVGFIVGISVEALWRVFTKKREH